MRVVRAFSAGGSGTAGAVPRTAAGLQVGCQATQTSLRGSIKQIRSTLCCRPRAAGALSRSQLRPPAAPAAPSWCSYAWFAISVKDFKWLEGASMWDWTKAKVGAAGARAAVHSSTWLHKVMSSRVAVRPSPRRPCTPASRHSLPTHSPATSAARIDVLHPCPALLCPQFSCCRWASCTTTGGTAARRRCRGCTPRRWRRGLPPARERLAPLPPSRPRA